MDSKSTDRGLLYSIVRIIVRVIIRPGQIIPEIFLGIIRSEKQWGIIGVVYNAHMRIARVAVILPYQGESTCACCIWTESNGLAGTALTSTPSSWYYYDGRQFKQCPLKQRNTKTATSRMVQSPTPAILTHRVR